MNHMFPTGRTRPASYLVVAVVLALGGAVLLTLVEHAPSWPGLAAGYAFGFMAAFLPTDRPTGGVVPYGAFGAFLVCVALTAAAVVAFLPMEFGSALLTMGGGLLAGWGYQRAQ